MYFIDEAAASSIHLGLQASVHSSGKCGKMKGVGCIVSNLFVFLFVFYRVEEDMVSTKPIFFYVIIWMRLQGC